MDGKSETTANQLYREELSMLGVERRELEAQIMDLQAKLRFNDKKQDLIAGLLEAEAMERKSCDSLPKLCEDCRKNLADWPSKLCPGCEAYREHTGAL